MNKHITHLSAAEYMKGNEMKTKYKHIYFVEFPVALKKPAYLCRNNKTSGELGKILYYPLWRKYVFEGFEGCVFDEKCLADIIDFMKQLSKP